MKRNMKSHGRRTATPNETNATTLTNSHSNTDISMTETEHSQSPGTTSPPYKKTAKYRKHGQKNYCSAGKWCKDASIGILNNAPVCDSCFHQCHRECSIIRTNHTITCLDCAVQDTPKPSIMEINNELTEIISSMLPGRSLPNTIQSALAMIKEIDQTYPNWTIPENITTKIVRFADHPPETTAIITNNEQLILEVKQSANNFKSTQAEPQPSLETWLDLAVIIGEPCPAVNTQTCTQDIQNWLTTTKVNSMAIEPLIALWELLSIPTDLVLFNEGEKKKAMNQAKQIIMEKQDSIDMMEDESLIAFANMLDIKLHFTLQNTDLCAVKQNLLTMELHSLVQQHDELLQLSNYNPAQDSGTKFCDWTLSLHSDHRSIPLLVQFFQCNHRLILTTPTRRTICNQLLRWLTTDLIPEECSDLYSFHLLRIAGINKVPPKLVNFDNKKKLIHVLKEKLQTNPLQPFLNKMLKLGTIIGKPLIEITATTKTILWEKLLHWIDAVDVERRNINIYSATTLGNIFNIYPIPIQYNPAFVEASIDLALDAAQSQVPIPSEPSPFDISLSETPQTSELPRTPTRSNVSINNPPTIDEPSPQVTPTGYNAPPELLSTVNNNEAILGTPSTVIRTRLDVRLFAHHNSCHSAQMWFKKLQEVDSQVAIIPWAQSNMHRTTIRDPDELPTTIELLNCYFNRIQAKFEDFTWCDVYIEHSVPWENILMEIADWLSSEGHNSYPKRLQVEKTTVVGWLLYSFAEISRELLADVLSEWTQTPLEVRYQNIYGGGINNTTPPTRTEALHVISAIEHAAKLRTRLARIYKTGNTEFPLFIRLRFIMQVPLNYMSPRRQQMLVKARRRQGIFLNMKLKMNSWELVNIDKFVNGYSLRKLVMDLRTETTNQQLFLSIDHGYKSVTNTIFTFLPRFQEEGRNTVASLYHTLKRVYPDIDIDVWFTSEAIERGGDFATDLDSQLEGAIDNLEDDEFFRFDEPINSDPVILNMEANHISAMMLGEETDTLGSSVGPVVNATVTPTNNIPIAVPVQNTTRPTNTTLATPALTSITGNSSPPPQNNNTISPTTEQPTTQNRSNRNPYDRRGRAGGRTSGRHNTIHNHHLQNHSYTNTPSILVPSGNPTTQSNSTHPATIVSVSTNDSLSTITPGTRSTES